MNGWVSEWGKLVYVGLRRLMIPIYLGILASYFLAHAISLSLSLSTNKRSIPVICPLCLTFFAFSIVQFTQYVGVYYTYPSSSALSRSFCLLHYLSSHSSFLYLCVFHFKCSLYLDPTDPLSISFSFCLYDLLFFPSCLPFHFLFSNI